MILPSAHQIGDKVELSFGESGRLRNCQVLKVHFTESKVMYDVDVEVIVLGKKEDKWTSFTRLYNVDSAFVTKPSP